MANVERGNICIYIDLENISGKLNLKKILQDIILKYETKSNEKEPVFVYKIACGNSNSISKFREQLKKLDFEIRETPPITNKKNRADLIISLDSFEKFYINMPPIDEFVFLTKDCDFSVIMNILRRYGKKVILVTNEEDSKREIFKNCSDDILLLDEYVEIENNKKEICEYYSTKIIPFKKDYEIENKEMVLGINKKEYKYLNNYIAIENLTNVLMVLDRDEEYLFAKIGSKFKDFDKTFNIGNTSFKNFKKLAEYFKEIGFIEIDSEKNKYDKIITIANLPTIEDRNFTQLGADIGDEILRGESTLEQICKKNNVEQRQAIIWASLLTQLFTMKLKPENYDDCDDFDSYMYNATLDDE